MATSKVVYFTVSGKDEQAEFRSDDSNDDVKETFRAAAEAEPHDILKLYNTKGNLVNISSKLVGNSADTRYRLDVVAAHISGQTVASRLGCDVSMMERRIERLERVMSNTTLESPPIVEEMKGKVESFRQKLEGVEHLSWLGLFKDISTQTSLQPFWKHGKASPYDSNQRVYENFKKISQVQITDTVRDYLRNPTFDNWQWDDSEMMVLLQQMFVDLSFINEFNIELSVLQNWIFEIYQHYNSVPFHNFKHCFMVAQMMYGLTWLIDLKKYLDNVDLLILMVSAICHDLDHPGYNNAYQINARTELALMYNDISPLENHHCAVAFEILEKPSCNIFKTVPTATYRRIREGMIKCILATDMAKHSEIFNSFKKTQKSGFDFTQKEHKDLLMVILIKVADISNEARPAEVSGPWLDCLFEEYFTQSDLEKLEGLPVEPFMDREKVTKSTSQVGFIKFVLLPLFEALGSVFPEIEEDIIEPVRRALNYYQAMQDALEEESRTRKENADLAHDSTTKTANGDKT